MTALVATFSFEFFIDPSIERFVLKVKNISAPILVFNIFFTHASRQLHPWRGAHSAAPGHGYVLRRHR